jgi:hypothetical protein
MPTMMSFAVSISSSETLGCIDRWGLSNKYLALRGTKAEGIS